MRLNRRMPLRYPTVLGHRARKFVYSVFRVPGMHVQTVDELQCVLWSVLFVAGYTRAELHDWFLRAAHRKKPKLPSSLANPISEVTTNVDTAIDLLRETSPEWLLLPERTPR